MTNRKRIFSTDERKSGFVKVSRSQLAALFGEEKEQALLARLLLSVQYHVFFKQGCVCMGKNIYTCYPGQWITSHLQIARMLELSRKKVTHLIAIMKSEGWIRVERLSAGCRISLNGYGEQPEDGCTGITSFPEGPSVSDADSFYGKGYY